MKKTLFYIYPETSSQLMGVALTENNKLIDVKLNSSCPKGYYYSVLNDARLLASELLNSGKLFTLTLNDPYKS